MSLGEYIPNPTTRLLLHMNGNSNDSSGNGNNGTDTNASYAQANGKFNSGVVYSTTNSFCNAPQSSIADLDLTHSFWINTSYSGIDNPTILDYFVSSVVNDRFQIRVAGSDQGANFGLAMVFLRGAAGQNVYRFSNSVINNGVWHHVCVTFNASTVSINIYIDGNLNQGVQTGTVLSPINTLTTGININSIAAITTTYTGMKFDELIVESREWTAAMVKKYYTNAIRGFIN